MYALQLFTGKRFEISNLTETKCYFRGIIKNYYCNGSDFVFKVHKNTMYIDYCDLSFFKINNK